MAGLTPQIAQPINGLSPRVTQAMTRVFQECSRLQIPAETIELITDEESDLVDLPDKIEELNLKEINGRLQITSVSADDSLSKYTPTAKIKGGYEERTVVFDEKDGCTHQSARDYRSEGWKQYDEDDLNTETVEYLNIKGHADGFLVHEQLRAEMFDVACQLAELATKGFIEGVIVEDGEMNAIRYEAGGETTEVELNIAPVDDPDNTDETDESDQNAQWAQY